MYSLWSASKEMEDKALNWGHTFFRSKRVEIKRYKFRLAQVFAMFISIIFLNESEDLSLCIEDI